MEFTSAQRDAIYARGGSLLVSAGAGSGKTRVLTERLMEYIDPSDPQVQPEDINRFLIITFTRAAAGELRGRITAAISQRLQQEPKHTHLRRQMILCRSAQIGTIHSFCGNLLREHAAEAGISPAFQILDEEKALRMRASALDRVLEHSYEAADPDFLSLADTVGAGRDDRRLTNLVLKLHGSLQSHARPEQWLQEQKENLKAEQSDIAETAWGRYYLNSVTEETAFWEADLRKALEEMQTDNVVKKAFEKSFLETADALGRLKTELQKSWNAAQGCFPIPFPRIGGTGKASDPALAETLKVRREACRESMKKLATVFRADAETLMSEQKTAAPAMCALLRLTEELEQEFQTVKRRANALDFSDLEHLTLKLLTEENGQQKPLAREISEHFREILVDEYQDVSRVQDSIFRALSRDGKNLFFVGDVKQSIYRFRLADPTIFTDCEKEYQRLHNRQDGRVIHLQENFRSRPEILQAVNAVFSRCMSEELGDLDYGEKECLIPGNGEEKGKPEIPELLLVPAEETEESRTELEARTVGERIRSLIFEPQSPGQTAFRYGDIAILLRSANTVGAVWRRVLSGMGIPVISEAGGDYFSSQEISVLFAMLQLLDNPHRDIPLITVLQSPSFGFTADRLGRIRAACPDKDFYTALCASEDPEVLQFLEKLSRLRREIPDLTPVQILDRIAEETDLAVFCSAMPDGEHRLQRIEEFSALAETFQNSGERGLHRFILWLQNLESRKKEPAPNAEGGDAVRILSIHKSKGLEFPVVFYSGLGTRFNIADLSERVLIHPEFGLGPKITDTERKLEYPSVSRIAIGRKLRAEMLSEEMRLMYVAMTRAKERLIMTACITKADEQLEKAAKLLSYERIPAALLMPAGMPMTWLLPTATGQKDVRCEIVYPETETTEQETAAATVDREADPDLLEKIRKNLSFSYPYPEAQDLPSKITATALKEREAADPDAQPLVERANSELHFEPMRTDSGKISAKQRGTATHLLLQQIDYGKAETEEGIREEIQRLVTQEFLTGEEAAAVDVRSVLRFFHSRIGKRVLRAEKRWREFRFSLLVKSKELLPEGSDEEILLQGAVDLCFEEDGALVIVDYKTDSVRNSAELTAHGEKYRSQLEAYAMAMERVFSMPVKEKTLWFLSAGKSVSL